jgi:hypothetical protein
MHLPRRDFLKSSAALAALPFAGLTARAASEPPANLAVPGPTGKGLLFDPSDLPRIRKNLEHPRLATLRAALTDFNHAELLQFIRHDSDLRNRVSDMREIREHLEHASLAFALYQKPADLELAQAALERILQYNPWDYFIEGDYQPLGFQRAPEATIAVCCALDWIGEHFSPETVAEAEHQIATKGAPACFNSLYGMMYPDRVRGWRINHRDDDIPANFDLSRWPLILNTTNLKIIPTCALGFAALWLHGRHPQAENWLQMARRSARAFSTMYGLDGSYDEGVGYWGYTTLHLALLSEAVYRRLGIDERDLINYPGTVRYAIAMSMPRLGSVYQTANEGKVYNFVPKGDMDPAIDSVNFGDSTHGTDTTIAAWVDRTHSDPVSAAAAAHLGEIKHLPGAVWFNPQARTSPPPDDLLDARLANDWIISRTDWTPASTVVAFRSGGPANHEHADRNSVIFKAHGERLFHDPFKAAYSPDYPRWLLRLTEAHTAVLIDGKGHQYHDGSEGTNASWAVARVTGYQADAAAMQVTSDATDAYQLVNDAVQRVDRSLLYLKPDVLLILDRLDLAPGHEGEFTARFQVFNEDTLGHAQVSGSSFMINRPHAGLSATCHGRHHTPLVALDRLDLPAEEGEFPFVASTSPRATSHALLTVVAAHPHGESAYTFDVASTASGWTVRGTHRGLLVNVTVDADQATQPFG